MIFTAAVCWTGPSASAEELKLTAPVRDSDGTYLIGTPGELAWFDYESTMVSEVRAMEMAEADVRLTADIDMTGYDWLVISAKESPGYPTPGYRYFSGGSYSGTFDGDGHVIRGLTIERENTYVAYSPQNRVDCVGLFGYLHSAVIKDLGVEGTIRVLDRSESNYGDFFHAGAIAGLVQKSEISGCYANVTIDITNDPDNPGMTKCDNYVGGIAGGISGGSVIENCYSRGSIYSECTRSVSAGGIVGATRSAAKEYDADGNYIIPNNNTVTKCWSDASVSINPEKMGCNTEPSYVGGIIGQVGAASDVVPIVSYCYALNPSLDGGSEAEAEDSFAARVVGSGELFELSGMYNSALDTMAITNAAVSSYNAEDTGYHNIWGKDITEAQAKSPVDQYGYNEYTLNCWNSEGSSTTPENVWSFEDPDQYPLFLWQTEPAEDPGEPEGDGMIVSSGIQPGRVYLITAADGTLALSSENSVKSIYYRKAVPVVMENGEETSGADLSSCLWTAEAGEQYTKLVNNGLYLCNNGSCLLAEESPACNDEWMYTESETTGRKALSGARDGVFSTAYGIGYSEYGDFFEAAYGDIVLYDVTPCAHEHRRDVVRVEATCTEDGYETYVCEDCGETVKEILPAAGHDYIDGVCSRCGRSEPRTVIVGSDSSFSNMVPYYNAAKYSTVQMIYTAEEIGGAGTIEDLSFMPAQKTYAQETGTVCIYMGHRTSSEFALRTDSVPAEDLALVYSGAPVLGSGETGAWETLTLDTPFEYNGNDNLVIAVTKSADTADTNLRYYYESTSYNSVLYRYGNTSDYADLTADASYYITKMRPYIRLTVAGSDAQTEVVKGDINGDGAVDQQDVTLAQKLALGRLEITAERLEAADCNGDGRITAADVLRIRKAAAGLIRLN